MSCLTVRRYLDAYVDGELDPATLIDIERHVAACAVCQEQLGFVRAFRQATRRALGAAVAPASLRERVRVSLDAAAASRSKAPGMLEIRYVVPVAAAAAAVLVFAIAGPGARRALDKDGPVSGPRQASVVPMLEDVVRLHSSELPADVTANEPQAVMSFFRNRVDFPVRPAVFDGQSARLKGARLSNVRDSRAAALYYDVRGRRVTVVVFASPARMVGGQRVQLLGQPLVYEQVRGYTVPVRKADGLTYAFTGDLDRQSMLQLAASARVLH